VVHLARGENTTDFDYFLGLHGCDGMKQACCRLMVLNEEDGTLLVIILGVFLSTPFARMDEHLLYDILDEQTV